MRGLSIGALPEIQHRGEKRKLSKAIDSSLRIGTTHAHEDGLEPLPKNTLFILIT